MENPFDNIRLLQNQIKNLFKEIENLRPNLDLEKIIVIDKLLKVYKNIEEEIIQALINGEEDENKTIKRLEALYKLLLFIYKSEKLNETIKSTMTKQELENIIKEEIKKFTPKRGNETNSMAQSFKMNTLENELGKNVSNPRSIPPQPTKPTLHSPKPKPKPKPEELGSNPTISFKGQSLQIVVDVNKNPTKKGIKIQFKNPLGFNPETKQALTEELQKYLNEGLERYQLMVNYDPDVPHKNTTIGFYINLNGFSKVVHSIFK